MPRFTEQEKDKMKEKLLLEGKKLFVTVNLKVFFGKLQKTIKGQKNGNLL